MQNSDAEIIIPCEHLCGGIYTILIHTVKEHLMITVFGKGQYGVVTIVFLDLLFYFFVFAFLRLPGTTPHRPQ